MNWKRYKFLIVAGAVSLVAVVLLVFFIFKAGAETSDLRSEVTRLKSEQSRLVSMRPFPSEESFTFLRDKQRNLEARRGEIQEIILENQIAPIPMNRSLFGDFIRSEFVPPLVAAATEATAGGEQGVILRDPAFGLQTYLDGGLPDPREIPALMVRLETMRHISGILFSSGISELVRIEPKSAEAERPGTRPRTGTAPAAGGLFATTPATQTRPDARAPEAVDGTRRRDELFEQITFTVSVKVYEDKLWGVLNAFSADLNQIVIRNLTITNSNQQLWPAYLRPDPRMGTPAAPRGGTARTERPALIALLEGATSESRAEAAPVRPGLQERREKTVGGELLDVSFDLTFYRLKPVAQGS